jgi:uncharacterized sulfatase
VVALLGALGAPLFAGASTAPANILFIVVDDLNTLLGCYGDRTVKSPNIDRLAAHGVRFDRAYAQYPVCNPSRSSFLTGLRPEQTGVLNNRTHFRTKLPDHVTLPEYFRKQGWYTAGYGKVFHTVGLVPEDQAPWIDADKSWDECRGAATSPTAERVAGRNLTGGKQEHCEWGATGGPESDDPEYQTASAAIAAMRKAGKRPWFVAAGFHRPHSPYICPKKYFDLYPPGSVTLHRDPEGPTTAARLAIPAGGNREVFAKFTDRDREEFVRAYYACVSFVDSQVGRLLEELDRAKARSRTLIVFLGDNGVHLGEHGWWNKSTLFEQSARVPLIMAAPGKRRGGVVKGPVELVDLYPTLADYAGLEIPAGLAGISLLPALDKPEVALKQAAFTMVSRGKGYGHSVRTERWRYTEWNDGRDGAELYDEQNDPQESRNVVAIPENAAVVAELKKLLATRLPATAPAPAVRNP